jgi:hypothetical protein
MHKEATRDICPLSAPSGLAEMLRFYPDMLFVGQRCRGFLASVVSTPVGGESPALSQKLWG